ncbi:MAG: hypothetical protein IPQ13_02250 [Holophagaceae bacterium]|nr:hypothetical protein [Holophagaceae bacterium]
MKARLVRTALLPTVAVLLLVGCDRLPFGTRPIGEVRKEAPSLEGKSVKVKGRVIDSNQLPFVGTRFYKIQDSTGELWVATKDPLPGLGETLVVTGELHNAAVLGGASMGIQIRERGRLKARR